VTGFVAKEIVVSTMGVLYQIGDEENEESHGLIAALKNPSNGITPLAAFAFMVFVLIYTPCLATIAAIRREAGMKLMFFSLIYPTALAWIMAFIVYQGGKLIGLS